MRGRLASATSYRQLALAFGCSIATAAFADNTASGTFAVWAIGLPHGYIIMEHQVKAIDVSAEDVARGFVRVANGTRFVVKTRAQGNYAVHFATRDTIFRSVQIEGIGRSVEFGARGGIVVQREVPAGKSVVAVNYRFDLIPGIQPGSYAWPLEVIARDAPADGFVASSPDPGFVKLSER